MGNVLLFLGVMFVVSVAVFVASWRFGRWAGKKFLGQDRDEWDGQ